MIFFDIDDTLLDNESARTAASLHLFHQHTRLQDLYDINKFPEIWNTITEKHISRYLMGSMTFGEQRAERIQDIFKQTLEKKQIESYFQTYLTIYEENWQLYPDVIPVLEKYRHVPKGIISNGDSEQQRQKLEKTGISHYFEIVVISGDIAISKPDPQIFLYAADKSGKDPSKCCYVGDKVDIDAKAAKDAGFMGVWLNRKFIDEKKEKVPEILSLDHFNYFE